MKTILVSSKHSEGCAWFAWKIDANKIDDIEFLVEDFDGIRRAYHVIEYKACRGVNSEEIRYAFDLRLIPQSGILNNVLKQAQNYRPNSGVVYCK